MLIDEYLIERVRGQEPEPMPDILAFADLGETDEWVLLAEEPGEEIVFGAIGAFWNPEIEWRNWLGESDEPASHGPNCRFS